MLQKEGKWGKENWVNITVLFFRSAQKIMKSKASLHMLSRNEIRSLYFLLVTFSFNQRNFLFLCTAEPCFVSDNLTINAIRLG